MKRKRNIGLVCASGSGGWEGFNKLSYEGLISSLRHDFTIFRNSDLMGNGHCAEYRELIKHWWTEPSVKTIGYIDKDKVVFEGRTYYFPD